MQDAFSAPSVFASHLYYRPKRELRVCEGSITTLQAVQFAPGIYAPRNYAVKQNCREGGDTAETDLVCRLPHCV